MGAFNFFRKKKGFVPVEEIPLKDEESRVIAIHEKQQAGERAQKRKAFDEKINKFKSFGKKFGGFGGSGTGLGNFGPAREDMFFGSSNPGRRRSSPRKKSKKRKGMSRQQREDGMFGDLGTDSFF